MSWLKKRLPKKRWKQVCIYLLSGFVILVAADMVLVQCWRWIDISWETTRITSPLKANGLPDYLAALNTEYSKGVTQENNAAPDLLTIIGTETFPEKWRKEILPQLGISTSASPYLFATYFDWLEKRNPIYGPGGNPDDANVSATQQAAMTDRYKEDNSIRKSPWKSSDYPLRLAWLNEQHGAIVRLHQALAKDRFYVPRNSLSSVDSAASLLPWTTGSRACGALLAADAMRAVGDSGAVEFHRDVLDIDKLARLVIQGSTELDYLIAVGIQDEGSLATQRGASTLLLKANEAHALLKSWLSLPAFPDESRVIDIDDRYNLLNSFCESSRRATASPNTIPALMNSKASLFFPNHYNGTLRTCNHYLDELVTAYQLPTYRQRAAAVNAVDTETVANRNWLSIGDLLVAIVVPSLGRSVVLHEQGLIDHDLATLTLALRIYREEYGAFPASLAELSPSVVSELPQDGFADAPFHYRREGRGYVLYSVGPDGKDDGGRNRQEASKAGEKGWDIVVRCME